jgi:hypothetical protein
LKPIAELLLFLQAEESCATGKSGANQAANAVHPQNLHRVLKTKAKTLGSAHCSLLEPEAGIGLPALQSPILIDSQTNETVAAGMIL